jgi:hypothetical protein
VLNIVLKWHEVSGGRACQREVVAQMRVTTNIAVSIPVAIGAEQLGLSYGAVPDFSFIWGP